MRLMDTPFGRQLDAIRTNEHRLAFLGFDPWRYKLAAFVLAADIAALSGARSTRCCAASSRPS